MPDSYFSTFAAQRVSRVVGWARAAAQWCEAQLGSTGRGGMAGLADQRVPRPNRTLISALTAVMLYIGLRMAGWSAAAQWVLAAVIVVASLAVAVHLLLDLEDGLESPPYHPGFSNDPDVLDAQLAEMRPSAAVTVDSELPVYSQCCGSLGFNPLAGAGVR